MFKKSIVGKAAKKVAALTMAAVLSVGMFGGCGDESTSSSGTSNGGSDSSNASASSGDYQTDPSNFDRDTITLTVFSERANYQGEQYGWTAQVMLDKFNVKLNIIPNSGGAFSTRMEAGDLGDIIVFGAEGDYMKARDAGLLFNWEEDGILDEFGSYMKDNCKAALEKNRGMNEDGKIYGLGYEVATSSKDIASFFYTWDIRWDLYQQLGHPEIKTMDDYLNMLIEMKKICPTDESGKPTYAFSLWPDWDGDMVMYVKSTATAYYGYDEFGIGLYDPNTGKFYGALDDGSPYLEMLQFYNKLYQNDLLDPDSMTATYDTMIEKVKKGGVFCSIFNYAGCLAYNTENHTSQNKIMRSMKPSESSPIVYGLNPLGGNNYWAIGAKSEYPDVCMQIINYIFTPEGRLTFEYGPKGSTWDYNDEGYLYFTELGKKTSNDNSTQMEAPYSGTYKEGECQINMVSWSIDAVNLDSKVGETYNHVNWKTEQTDAVCDADKDWREFTGCTSVNEYMKKGNYTVSPGSAFVGSQKSDELKTTWNQVTKCITEYTWKAIYAKDDKEFASLVKAMKAKAKGYGYQECWDWTNAEAQRRKAAEDAAKANQE